VAGDETQARAVLAEMQGRLALGPYVALGVQGSANPSEIRTAFLQLTKTYHPTRFARMSNDVQRLSNEVFLALRGAHDALAKPAPAGRANQSGIVPTVATTAAPAATRPSAAMPVPSRTPSTPFPAYKPPAAAPSPPSPPRPADAAVNRTNDSGVRLARVAVSPPASAPKAAGAAPAPARPGTPPAKPEDRELAPVLEMLQRQQWDSARAALNTLATRSPQATKIRALQSYARGREAQLDRRLDEARVELDQALQLDPELQLAKTALAELFTRRK
jgi:curved DNA-binding protein CbpA